MDSRLTFHTDSRILEIRFNGSITHSIFRELYASIMEACAGRLDQYNRLWDLRGASFDQLDDHGIRAIVDDVLSKVRRNGNPIIQQLRSAIVVDSDIGFGHGRKFEILFDLHDGHSIQFKVVRSYVDAIEFLTTPS